MRKSILVGALSCLLVVGPALAWAADDADTTALKKQVESLESQLKDLKDRIKTIEDGQKKKADEDKAAPKKVEAGFGSIKVNGLMQNWYTVDSEGADTFKTRRMEIKLSGQINPKTKWAVMIDPAKELKQASDNTIRQESRILQDVSLSYLLSPALTLDIGQFKTPIGMEGLMSSSQLDTIERALFSVRGNDTGEVSGFGGMFSDNRDLGAILRGTFDSGEYQLGLFNGEKQNNSDTNDGKSVAARVALKPKSVPGLQLGGSYYNGEVGASGLDRNRIGAELRYQNDEWTVASEFLKGKDETSGFGDVDGDGWYALVGYKLDSDDQIVLRYDTWNAPSVSDKGDEKDWTLGWNHFLAKHNAKIQFNLVRKQFDLTTLEDQTLFRTNFQIAF